MVSPDAGKVLAEIRELRDEQREQLSRDLAAIDAEYDRAVRRVSDASAFPLAAPLMTRARTWLRRLRRRPR